MPSRSSWRQVYWFSAMHIAPGGRCGYESVTWTGDVMTWASGEAEVGILRLADGWVVNKHYDWEPSTISRHCWMTSPS